MPVQKQGLEPEQGLQIQGKGVALLIFLWPCVGKKRRKQLLGKPRKARLLK